VADPPGIVHRSERAELSDTHKPAACSRHMTVQSTGTRAANTEYGKMLRPRLVRGRRFAPTAVVDGKLTTGQNPQSVRATAALLIAALHHSSAAANSAKQSARDQSRMPPFPAL
jgi:hypothetical protein